MKKILFILDRAHGKGVAGKASPDGSHIEWIWSDNFIKELKPDLLALNIPFVETVTDQFEPGLTERVKRANAFSKDVEYPIMLSFHNNAGGGTGNEIWTSPGQDTSDIVANIIAENIIKSFPELKWRRHHPNMHGKESHFTVLAGNKNLRPEYSAVLFEWLFMDHPQDLLLLKDKKYTTKLKEVILYSIVEICKRFGYGNFQDELIVK